MAFLILQNSTTADASDVNANFYHVAQGSRLPMGGNSLEATDSVYDLGASTATWNNLFCQNIYINNTILTADRSLWVLEAETTLSATASSIEFSGINGDDAKDYRIIIIYNDIISPTHLYFNEDSTTSNYGFQNLYAQDTVVTATRKITSTGIYLLEIASGGGMADIIFNSKTGLPKMCLINQMINISTTTISILANKTSIWNDAANTLTSIKFVGSMETGTTVQLWKRG